MEPSKLQKVLEKMKFGKMEHTIRCAKGTSQAHFNQNARVEVERSLRYWFSVSGSTGKKTSQQATLDRWIERRRESDA